ncbi:MAG TPA: hypothetical protein VGJ60_14185 [Chloroflexota bacterium]
MRTSRLDYEAPSRLAAYGALLADDVRWGDTCNNRSDVLTHLAGLRAAGMRSTLTECCLGQNAILVGFDGQGGVARRLHGASTRC